MAKKSGTKGLADKYRWLGHIQVYFNDIERVKVLAYIDDRDADIDDIIMSIVQMGIGIKFSFLASGEGYSVSLQPKESGHYLRGYTVGYKHVEFDRLVRIVSYIVGEMMEHQAIAVPSNGKLDEW